MAKKKSKARVFVIILVVLLIVLIPVVYFVVTSGNKKVSVVTSKVEKRTITQSVSAIGKIEPETEVKVSSQTSGEIIYLGPKEGDTVRSGQIVVRIKPDIIETQLEQYRAAADATRMETNVRKAEKDRAQAELQRMTELYEKEYVSKQDFERAKASYDQALSSYRASLSRYDQSVATLKQFQRSADRTTIFAPIDGIITRLDVEKGEKVVGTEMMQGTEMMRISDLSVMNAMVDVDENDIVMVSIGDTTRVEIDAFPDRIFTGIVVEIGHSAKLNALGTQDQVTNFEVKIRIMDDEPRLRPGMSCNVDIETETRTDVLSVPLQAVTVRDTTVDQKPDVGSNQIVEKEVDNKKDKKKRPPAVVFLNDKGKAKMVLVETGISDKGYIEIKDGLKLKDVVISGSFMAVSKELKDGMSIKVDSNYRKRFRKR